MTGSEARWAPVVAILLALVLAAAALAFAVFVTAGQQDRPGHSPVGGDDGSGIEVVPLPAEAPCNVEPEDGGVAVPPPPPPSPDSVNGSTSASNPDSGGSSPPPGATSLPSPPPEPPPFQQPPPPPPGEGPGLVERVVDLLLSPLDSVLR